MRISKETLKLLESGGHRIISMTITGDEAYIPFYDVPTRSESRVWVHEVESTPTMVKKQRSVKDVMYAIFFVSKALLQAIKLEDKKNSLKFSIRLKLRV